MKQQLTTPIPAVPLDVTASLRREAEALHMTLGELVALLLRPALMELRAGRLAAQRSAVRAASHLKAKPPDGERP